MGCTPGSPDNRSRPPTRASRSRRRGRVGERDDVDLLEVPLADVPDGHRVEPSSKLNRNGLRRPYDQIWLRPGTPRNGLSRGTRWPGREGLRRRTGSIRRSLPSRLFRLRAPWYWSPPPPPSPVASQSMRSGPNADGPAVVVRSVLVRDRDHQPAAGPPRPGRVVAPDLELLDADRAAVGATGVGGEVEVEAAAAGIVGSEGDREQPLLALIGDEVGDVEEGALEGDAVAQDADRPLLLGHEEVARAAWGGGDEGRLVERVDQLGLHARGGACGGRSRRARRRQRREPDGRDRFGERAQPATSR